MFSFVKQVARSRLELRKMVECLQLFHLIFPCCRSLRTSNNKIQRNWDRKLNKAFIQVSTYDTTNKIDKNFNKYLDFFFSLVIDKTCIFMVRVTYKIKIIMLKSI